MLTLAALAIIVPLFLWAKARERRHKPAKPPPQWMDAALFYWGPDDPFTIRDLLRSISIMGASGSGKTSSVGLLLGRSLAASNRVGMLIIASKPEDRVLWEGIARAAGRELIVFAPGENHRFNVIDFEAKHGADAREITECVMTIGESLTRGVGNGREPFWELQNRRAIHNAVELLMQAHEKVDAWDIQRFINGAALAPSEIGTDLWKGGFHNQTLAAASKKAKTKVQEHDFKLAEDFWLSEWPNIADKTRSGIFAGILGILHVFNTGSVRELIGTDTTISPDIFDEGAMVLVDLPVAKHGVSANFVCGAWKYATQRHILRRAATEHTPVTVVWIDEFQNHMSSFDAKFLAECRSHNGCMVLLTQSMHSFFTSIGGKEAQSHTKALLSNLATKVFMTLGDEESAKYASSLVGRAVLRLLNSSMSYKGNMIAEIAGDQRGNISLNEHYEQQLLESVFMSGLKTGGPENGFICEGFVIKNGASFSSRLNFIRVAFSQR